MPIKLQNEQIELSVQLADEGYLASRFDRTGKIVDAKFKNISFASQELLPENMHSNCGIGFFNEFGINSPLGFEQVPNGQQFHKIGVGILEKDDEHYNFLKAYKVENVSIKSEHHSTSIKFLCTAPLLNGFAYKLEKEISLTENGFVISYLLDNTGEKSIVTSEYVHNFIAIDKRSIGPNYVLHLPCPIEQEKLEEYLNPDKAVLLTRNEIQFIQKPDKAHFFSNLSGDKLVDAYWRLEHKELGISISEKTDFQTKSINVWGWGHVISPELFLEIHLAPGNSKKWHRSYTFSETI